MQNLGVKLKALSLLLALASGAAFAAEGTGENTSAANANDFISRIYFNYSATYHGPNTQDIGSSKTVDGEGKITKSTVNMDGDTTTAYRLSDTIGVGAYVPFLLVPVGQNFVLGDVGGKVFDSRIILGEGLYASANLMVQLPTSDYSKARKMDVGIKFTPGIRYAFANSNFTIGAANELKEYAGVIAGKTFKLWSLPYVNYKLMKNFSVNVAYEMEWDHFVKEKAMNLRTTTMDIQPGFVWNVTKTVMFNPYVQIFAMNQLSADRTAVGAYLNATLL